VTSAYILVFLSAISLSRLRKFVMSSVSHILCIGLLTFGVMGCTYVDKPNVETTEQPPPVPLAEPLEQEGEEGVPVGDVYQVQFETSKGNFIIEVHPEWAPIGAAHFKELVEAKFYDDCRFFRVVKGFMAQVGMNGDPQVHQKWTKRTIKDDRVRKHNLKGYVTFAKPNMPNSRSTQFFINYGETAGSMAWSFRHLVWW